MNTRLFTFHLPPSLLDDLREESMRRGTSISALIREAITLFLTTHSTLAPPRAPIYPGRSERTRHLIKTILKDTEISDPATPLDGGEG